jgi:hypothetical protein
MRVFNTPDEEMELQIPYDEGAFLQWDQNPYVLDGGSGYIEYAPSTWLISYWLARYFEFIVPANEMDSNYNQNK